MDAHHHIEDVVDMQVEEGQRQGLDEQQQDDEVEDVNMDEQEDGAEERGEDGDVVIARDEVNVDNNETLRQEFDLACGRIQQNDPDFISFCPEIKLDDVRAILLGRALIGNTALGTLYVTFLDQTEFTSRGARAFVAGVSGSQIKSLSLEGEEELPLEMSQLWAWSIEKLHLHFPFGIKFATRMCKCLTENKLLSHFSVNVDEMTPRIAQVLSNFLRTTRVTSLAFIGYPSHNATLTMHTLYTEGVHCCRYIEKLSFDFNAGDMRELITMLPKLQTLIIRNVGLSLSEVELLAHGLRNANQLHTLSLYECELHQEHMSMLAPVLGNHPSIKVMVLDNNFLGDAGVAIFVEHWQPESLIEKLALSQNDIGPNGAELLLKASSSHPTLHLLDLHYNEFIGFDGLKLIGKALPDAKIPALNLVDCVSWTNYADVACEAAVIQEAKRMASGKALLEGVQGNEDLLAMRLEARRGESHLPANAVQEIDLYIEANALGRHSVLKNQHILPSGVWGHFFAKEEMSSSLMFLFLQELLGAVMGGSRNSSIGRKRCWA